MTADPIGDVKVLTRQVLERIDHLLQKAGTHKSKLLLAQVWLANMRDDFDNHNSVWNDWVDRQNPPARACVGAPLWQPGILVEIMVTAAR
jgi:enamine deaminase RidA (YjgF/YER057c/UK114 family)